MGAEIINGKAVSSEVVEGVKEAVLELREKNIVPGLAVVIVGEDPASQVYVRSKGKRAKECGFLSRQYDLDASISEQELLDIIDELNKDEAIHGILVQLPLPNHIDEKKVISAIRQEKDVDGFHPVNVGLLSSGDLERALIPCTPWGSLLLIKRVLKGELSGKEAVVIGRSNIVGKPMAQLLLSESCTVTLVHSRTKNIESVVKRADIVVAAVGRPQMVKGSWIKKGAVVIDVGINRIAAPEKGEGKSKLVGDVDYDDVIEHAFAATPVPGGVGPMTIAMLMVNTLIAAYRSNGLQPRKFV